MVMLRPLSGRKTPSVWMILFRASYTPLYCALGSGCRLCIRVFAAEKHNSAELFSLQVAERASSWWSDAGWYAVPWCAVTLFWQRAYLAAAELRLSDACLCQGCGSSLFYCTMPSYLDITKPVLFAMRCGAGAGDKFYLPLHVSFLRRNNKISLTFPFDTDLGTLKFFWQLEFCALELGLCNWHRFQMGWIKAAQSDGQNDQTSSLCRQVYDI